MGARRLNEPSWLHAKLTPTHSILFSHVAPNFHDTCLGLDYCLAVIRYLMFLCSSYEENIDKTQRSTNNNFEHKIIVAHCERYLRPNTTYPHVGGRCQEHHRPHLRGTELVTLRQLGKLYEGFGISWDFGSWISLGQAEKGEESKQSKRVLLGKG